MMITVLAVAMTVLMLIATVVSMHNEAVRVKLEEQRTRSKGFGTY